MTNFEKWTDAYGRIKREVEAEMPDANEADQYEEYARRCDQWKAERGIKL